jgi:hypothetical protein
MFATTVQLAIGSEVSVKKARKTLHGIVDGEPSSGRYPIRIGHQNRIEWIDEGKLVGFGVSAQPNAEEALIPPPQAEFSHGTRAPLTLADGAHPAAPVVELDRLTQLAEDTRSRMKRCAADILQIGLNLIEAKELLGYGEFLPWIKAEFEMSERSAQNFMNVGKAFEGKSAKFADLDGFSIAASALYELASPSKTSPEAVTEAVDRAREGEVIDRQKAQEILGNHRPTKQRPKRETASERINAVGRSLGLNGGKIQQLPSIPSHPDVPPERETFPTERGKLEAVPTPPPPAPAAPLADYHSAWVSNLDQMPDEMLIAAVRAIVKRANLEKRSADTLKEIIAASDEMKDAASKLLEGP